MLEVKELIVLNLVVLFLEDSMVEDQQVIGMEDLVEELLI